MTDYISRADAIEAVLGLAQLNGRVPTDSVIFQIKALPSADAVSRKAKCCPIAETCMSIDCPVSSEYIGRPSADAVQGEWQKVEEQPYFRKHYDTVCCSVCRRKGNRKWNYCPNCGAIMKGGAE